MWGKGLTFFLGYTYIGNARMHGLETLTQPIETTPNVSVKYLILLLGFIPGIFYSNLRMDLPFVSQLLLIFPVLLGMLLFQNRLYIFLMSCSALEFSLLFSKDIKNLEFVGLLGLMVCVLLARETYTHHRSKYDLLYAQSQSQINRLSALRQIDLHITTNKDIKTTLALVTDQALHLSNVIAANIYLLEREKNLFQWMAGNGPESISRTIPLHLHPAYECIQENNSLYIGTLRNSGLFDPSQERYSNCEFFHYLVLPLLFNNRILGTLEIIQQPRLPLEDHVLTYLETLAGQAAIAVQHAAAFTHLETVNTQLQATVRELSETKDVLEKSQKIGLIGSWRYKTKTKSVEWSQELFNIYGLSSTHIELSFETIFQLMLPEDKILFQQSMEQLFLGQNISEIQYRINHPDGSVRHLITKCEAFQDEQNQITEIIGTVRDRTEHKQAELDAYGAHLNLKQAYETTLEGWARALDLRDHGTEGHAQRVTHLSLLLAKILEIPESEWIHIRRGALLHDIGKIGIPDSILLKPGNLSGDEWCIMRKHPQFAYELLSPISYLRPSLDIPLYHHEKWDGSGYPYGLQGEEIPLAARIFAIVDVLDALCSDRPYRKAWSLDQTRDYLIQQSGIHFDPKIISALLTHWERIVI